jgi:hypothetical protein
MNEQTKIGEGMFGEVFRGRMWGTEVAIKKLKTQGLRNEDVCILSCFFKGRKREASTTVFLGRRSRCVAGTFIVCW